MMRIAIRTFRRFGLTAAMLALGLDVCPAQAPASATGRVISGVVVSAKSGEPLAEAQVVLTLTRGKKFTTETATDAEGRFTFGNLSDGKYNLAASHRGYIAASYEEHESGVSTAIVTGDGLISTGLRFELQPQAAIYGTVADDSGDPVSQARLSLYRKDTWQGTGKMVRATVISADAMGNFEFSKLQPGSYYACAFGAPWYAKQSRNHPGSQLDPASERRLAALDVAYAPTCYPNVTEASAAALISVGAGERVEVDIAMHASPAMHFELQLPSLDFKRRQQMPQFTVDMFGSSEWVGAPVNYATNNGGNQANGPFTVEIGGIAAGQYAMYLPGENGDSRRMMVDASAESTIVDLSAATANSAITGKVTMASGGSLPEQVMVWLTPQVGNQPATGSVGADGTFKTQTMMPGEYEVTVSASGYWMAIAGLRAKGATLHGHVLKIGSDPVELTVAVGEANTTVNGLVQHDGKPESGVFVVLAPADAYAGHALWRSNQSDSDGTFNFDRIASGEYKLAAIEKGWTLDWARPEAMAPYLARGVNVTVTPGAREVNLKDALEAQPRDAPAANAPAAAAN